MPISPYLRNLREKIGTELVLSPGVGGIVRDAEGRILVQRQSETGEWDIPGGGVDPGEDPAQALVREIREETGLIVRPVHLIGVFGGRRHRITYPNGDQVEYTSMLFECEIVGGSLSPQDGEVSELGFFAPDEMPPVADPYPEYVYTQKRNEGPAHFHWDEAWLGELE